MPVHVEPFFHAPSGTFSYVVADPSCGQCAIIDAVLGFEMSSGRTDTASADRIETYVRDRGLAVQWLLETHVHADHLSGAAYLRDRLGGRIAIGTGVSQVHRSFQHAFGLGGWTGGGAGGFDVLLADGACFCIGQVPVRVLAVPGHTPADVAYVVGDGAAFVGDTLFMPDIGTARCDFPGGNAGALYRSVQRLLALPADTVLYLCHDYPPLGRSATCSCTVADQRARNIHVRDGITEPEFVRKREARDATLALPQLMLPSIQVNVGAGTLPAPEGNGVRYLRVPIDLF